MSESNTDISSDVSPDDVNIDPPGKKSLKGEYFSLEYDETRLFLKIDLDGDSQQRSRDEDVPLIIPRNFATVTDYLEGERGIKPATTRNNLRNLTDITYMPIFQPRNNAA